MVNFEFDRIVMGEEFKSMMVKELGAEFRVEIKKNRIGIVQNAAKGCAIILWEKG